jgi:hypothetical protein
MIDDVAFKRLVKEAVKEAMQEGAAPAFTTTAPGYEEAFHQIMAEVARGNISTTAAGKLIAEAYQQHHGAPAETPAPNLQDWIQGMEQEVKGYSTQQAEKTIQMLERMKAKLQAKADEARYHIEVKKIQEEEAKAKAAANLQALKDRMSSQ